ncbi:hypothetical protein CR513_34256, partial [Mucuna pruriens]
MAKAICQWGPWSVSVSPCRHGESVSTTSLAEGKPFFYLYDTLHSNLGVKLPFTHFERSYKSFKTRFFKLAPSDSGPNLLLDRAGRPFFPLSWTHQPAVSITVRRKDLKEWEDAFARELEELPVLPSADIIKGTGYSSHALRDLKKRAAQMTKEEHQSAASAEPLAAAEPSPQRRASKETSNSPSLVVLNQATHTSSPIVQEANESSSRESEERPKKHAHIEEPDIVEPVEVDPPSTDFRWDTLLIGYPPTSSIWGPTSLLGQAVDKGLASFFDNHKVKQLGVVGACNALQQYATYSLVLARAVDKEFGRLESQRKSCAERAKKAEIEFLNLSKAFSEVEVKIKTFRSANAALEEDL